MVAPDKLTLLGALTVTETVQVLPDECRPVMVAVPAAMPLIVTTLLLPEVADTVATLVLELLHERAVALVGALLVTFQLLFHPVMALTVVVWPAVTFTDDGLVPNRRLS